MMKDSDLTGSLESSLQLARRQGAKELESLLEEIRACRLCRDRPAGSPLPHAPRPVLQVSPQARLLIAGQAPGTRVHASGRPFTDPSGDRLRRWLGMDEATFYDPARVAIVPMGLCFPGQNARGADLPPRPECARHWRARILKSLPALRLVLAVGRHAQLWHLGKICRPTLTETVRHWREGLALNPPVVPLPHPSWRNNAWLKRNPWFEAEVLPWLRERIGDILAGRDDPASGS
jgi:uracil-DNA glycosylase